MYLILTVHCTFIASHKGMTSVNNKGLIFTQEKLKILIIVELILLKYFITKIISLQILVLEQNNS